MTRRLNDQDRIREQRRQERLLLLLERKFSRIIRAEIKRASVEMADRYEATGSPPQLPESHAQNLTGIYKKIALVSIEVFGGRILDQGKALGLVRETKFSFSEFFERIAVDYILSEAIRQRITAVAETTRNQIINQIVAGQNGGLGVSAIASLISTAIPSISRTRGALIARTETHGAANVGADQAARATGLVLQKEWTAARDERTRQAHADADGDIVGMDESFNVGGEMMRFAGDPNGSAGNIINCRCGISHIVVE